MSSVDQVHPGAITGASQIRFGWRQIKQEWFESRTASLMRFAVAGLCPVFILLAVMESRADEGGISLWLPGIYGSLAAVPRQPGLGLSTIYYHTNVSAGGSVSAAGQITIGNLSATANVNLNASLHAVSDLAFIVPRYVFATPILGGQLTLSMTNVVGRN